MSRRSRCRSCQADVIFVPSGRTNPAGHMAWMILDATPAKGVLLVNRETGIPVNGAGYPDTIAAVWDTYTDHHVSCPQAKEWKDARR
jgi:hypothetical protein